MKLSFFEIIKSLPVRQACQSVIQTIYDIVKAHHGELNVETQEGEGSTFLITLTIM